MYLLFPDSGSALSIDLETNQALNWLFGKVIETDIQTRDECHIKFEHENGMITYRGYVPNFFPGKHYGDFLYLKISATGIVENLKVTDADIEAYLREQKQYRACNIEGFE